ncbi:MAG TPA: prephenate dehydratase domain-containing protein, partial [Candidatus Nanoarchaeia archaeon]|nr:prephenate dehydratase domain-containing protein [Candidatus Nanoarchaeia archaeon]
MFTKKGNEPLPQGIRVAGTSNGLVAVYGGLWSFSYQASLDFFPGLSSESILFQPRARDLFGMLMEGVVGTIVVPLENTVIGPIPDIEAQMEIYGNDLVQRLKRDFPIPMACGGLCRPEEVREIASTQASYGQCKGSLDARFPGHAYIEVQDTAQGVERIAMKGAETRYAAGLAPARAF